MRILIMGLPKSGTTALYSAIRQSLPARYTGMFEPVRLELDSHDLIVKILLGAKRPAPVDRFDEFDRKIFIVRDPRDTLVSRINYQPYNLVFYRDAEKRAEYLRLLDAKQKDPRSVPLSQFLEFLSRESGDDLAETITRDHDYVLNFGKEHGLGAGQWHDPFHEIRRIDYDHLIRCQWSWIESYLHIPIKFRGRVDDGFMRVERKMKAGDWRNWFTLEDVEFWKPRFRRFDVFFDKGSDWKLSPNPLIEYEHSVGYFRKIINEREAMDEWPKSGTSLPFEEWRQTRWIGVK